jgi:hypothetical protein
MTRLALLATLLTGCGASISGEVDGQTVSGAREAIFDEISIDLGPLGDFRTFVVMVTDLKDSCRVYDDIIGNVTTSCADQCSEWGRIADEDLGANAYYNVSLRLTADPDRVPGDYGHVAGLPGEDEFAADFTRYDVSALYDEAGCVETCEAGNPVIEQNPEDSSGGSLTIDDYVDGDQLKGSFELAFGAESLTGSFKAERCNAMTAWFGLGE